MVFSRLMSACYLVILAALIVRYGASLCACLILVDIAVAYEHDQAFLKMVLLDLFAKLSLLVISSQFDEEET